jgi:hypothetical protein
VPQQCPRSAVGPSISSQAVAGQGGHACTTSWATTYVHAAGENGALRGGAPGGGGGAGQEDHAGNYKLLDSRVTTAGEPGVRGRRQGGLQDVFVCQGGNACTTSRQPLSLTTLHTGAARQHARGVGGEGGGLFHV